MKDNLTDYAVTVGLVSLLFGVLVMVGYLFHPVLSTLLFLCWVAALVFRNV